MKKEQEKKKPKIGGTEEEGQLFFHYLGLDEEDRDSCDWELDLGG